LDEEKNSVLRIQLLEKTDTVATIRRIPLDPKIGAETRELGETGEYHWIRSRRREGYKGDLILS
jgi:hypothetical protein